MDHNLQLLGLARKAALLAVGGEDTSKAARNGKAVLIITADDASAGSKRRARENARSFGIMYLEVPYTMFELGTVSGRGSPATLAFLEPGLAAGFLGGLAKKEPDSYKEHAELLAQMARDHNSWKADNYRRPVGKGRTAK
jgi:ribosomal protein L7Ae-like RNA K-turn-binding protein